MLKTPLNLLKTFKLKRTLSWKKRNRPFNPQEAWRTRPRKLISGLVPITPYQRLSIDARKIITPQIPALQNVKFFNPLSAREDKSNISLLTEKCTRVANWFRLALKSPGFFIALKLKYKGKSFRWHRKARSILLRFGHSHLVIAKPKPNIFWRKHGRQKIIFWGTNKWYLWRFLKKTVAWRPMNIYHGRGLRLTKQKVWRKAGKVSAYR